MHHNPLENFKRPRNSPARERRISEREIQLMCLALGYQIGNQPTEKREFVGAAFLFAIETAMRAGEICTLTQSDINLKKSTAKLTKTKNGDDRSVPLSKKAKAILNDLPKPPDNETPLFQLKTGSLSTIFRRHRSENTPIEGLTFHDTRHEAITRLARKIHVLDLARMTGHRELNQLLTYYNPTTSDIASLLDNDTVE